MEYLSFDSFDQNQKSKTMLNGFRQTLSFLFFLAILTSYNNKKPITKTPESISPYVYAYTSGEISKAAPIRIRFTNALIESDKIGTEVEKDIISFQPRIKGEATWEDDRTIYFKPSKYLPAKEKYFGKINLKKLCREVPNDAQLFEFDFEVKEQNCYVRLDG